MMLLELSSNPSTSMSDAKMCPGYITMLVFWHYTA